MAKPGEEDGAALGARGGGAASSPWSGGSGGSKNLLPPQGSVQLVE